MDRHAARLDALDEPALAERRRKLGHAHGDLYAGANGLGSDLVGAMARDANGDLWVATFAGLSRLHAGNDCQLHDRQRTLKQRGDGAAAARRRHAV